MIVSIPDTITHQELERKLFLKKITVRCKTLNSKRFLPVNGYIISDQGDPDRWLPSKKGVNLSLDMWEAFKELIEKIDQALGDKP